MKTLLTGIVSLLLGVAIGLYAEGRHCELENAQIVRQMIEASESSDHLQAVTAVRAIESIQSGDTRQAVHVLSRPAAEYYTQYAALDRKDEHRAKALALIEQLARTNELVAARIAELSSNTQVRTR